MKSKVSVCMITYNHEKYIAQAIESVMAQKTNFDFELIIGEDYSTDNTKNILIEYQKKYPKRIKLILLDKNIGMMKNFIQTLKTCKGEYVAFLEGDDYWSDKYKLLKQVNLLNASPTYSMCFHTTEAFYESNPKNTYFIPSQNRKKGEYSVEDILQYNFIASCSVMYRNNLVKKLPSWFNLLEIGDWPLHILYAMHGPIGYIDEVMARYRIHNESHFSSRTKITNFLDIIKTQRRLDRGLRYRHHDVICKVVSDTYRLLYEEYLKINDKTHATNALRKTYEYSPHC